MNRGRTRSSRAVTGLGSVCIGCVGLVAVACGDSFTTAPADGGSAPDAIATSDATGPAADAGKPWCRTLNAVHTFCEDFSSGVPGMQLTTLSMGGMIAADMMDYTYAPPSLLATTFGLTGTNATATAIATKSFSSNLGSHFSLSLDLKIDGACVQKNDHNPVSVLAIEFPESNYGIAIQVLAGEIDADEIALVGSAPLQTYTFPTILPTGWERWALDINGAMLGVSAGPKAFNLTVGMTSAFTKQPLQKAPTLALQHPTLVVGAVVKNLTGESPMCKVHVDNILFDVRLL